MRFMRIAGLFAILTLATVACTAGPTTPQPAPTGQSVGTKSAPDSRFDLVSNAFKSGESIPSQYTCDGENVSPQLSWSGVQQNVASFALIVDDPDAPRGVYTHWVIFNLPSSLRSLAKGIPNGETLDNGAIQGRNDGGTIGYTGPCPPAGAPHLYRFSLYALDASLSLKAGASKQQVLDAMQGHSLDQAQLIGTYQRKTP